MNNERENKKNTFNPADYDYLDSAPFEDWISEILDRNEEFKSYCSKICSENKGGRIGLSEYKVWVPASEKKTQYTKSGKLKVILMRQPVKVYRMRTGTALRSLARCMWVVSVLHSSVDKKSFYAYSRIRHKYWAITVSTINPHF